MWSPTTPVSTLNTSELDEVTALLLVRMHTEAGGKRKRLARPPARRIDAHIVQTAQSQGSELFSGKSFYNGLLVARFKSRCLRRAMPLYIELQSFVEAGLDV